MHNRETVILVGPNGHLGKEILIELLKNYIVIGISRNSSKINIPIKLKNYYLPIEHDLEEIKEKELLNKIKTFLNLKKTVLHGIVNNGYFGYPDKADSIRKSDVYLSAEGIFGLIFDIIL